MSSRIVTASVIRHEAPLPDDVTRRHALFCLYALHDWECLPKDRPSPYAPGFFYNRIHATLAGLNNISRNTVFKHLHTTACLVCDAPIDLRKTTLDHLMPRHEGGPQSPNNTLLLCRHCNSSKGKKDLLEWWIFKQYKATELPLNVLCLYARIYWQHLGEDRLSQSAPLSTRAFVAERLMRLPSDAYRIALVGAAYAGSAFARWLREP